MDYINSFPVLDSPALPSDQLYNDDFFPDSGIMNMAELEHHHEIQSDHGSEEEDEEEFNYDDNDQQVFDSGAWFVILKHRLSSSGKRRREWTAAAVTETGSRKLWTNEIIKLAGERIIKSSSAQEFDVPSMLNNPFHLSDDGDGQINSDSGLTQEEAKNVELMEYLLACAEKVGKGNFDRAIGLLNLCDCLASQTGNTVQRLAYHFCNALRLRIQGQDQESDAGAEDDRQPFESDTARTLPDDNAVEFRKRVPFYSASQLAAVQIMVENVVGETRIHVIELRICSGLLMIALMQALSGSDSSIELLRITALANDESEEEFIHGSGQRLAACARAMGLPFAFNLVRIWASPLGPHKDQLDLEPKEATIVISNAALSPLIAKPRRLDAMMKLIRSIRPRVMVVIESEANHNAPDFGHRFVETLFTAGGHFDSMAACMEGQDAARTAVESWYLYDRIRNILVAEGEKRVVRDVKIRVWRKYFARFGMLEIPIRGLALQHANMVIRESPCAASCLVTMDYKSLMIGWMDMPLLFVSAWKFMKAIPH